jgi:hypothetical protein
MNMSYKIKKLTPEELEERRRQFPRAGVDLYLLAAGNVNLSYHPTGEEARKELTKWQGRDKVVEIAQSALDEALEKGKKYGVEDEEIRTIFRDAV